MTYYNDTFVAKGVLMGQYYKIINASKQEILYLNGKSVGGKLTEIAYHRQIDAILMELMTLHWKGDAVYIIGDYADTTTPNTIYFDALRQICEKFQTDDLYAFAKKHFVSREVKAISGQYRYIYNHELQLYIDNFHCISSNVYKGDWAMKYISPLILLLAMGNGQGSGDYYGTNEEAGVILHVVLKLQQLL